MLRHIAWFNEASVEPSPDGSGLVSADQNVCSRCLIPARELEKLGVECSVFGNLSDADPAHVSQHLQKLNTDIVIIGKMSGPSLVKLARAAKQLGCYVIADFGEGKTSPENGKLAEIADQMVVTSNDAAAKILKETGSRAFVISDCDEKSANDVAHAWLECFKQLKVKPPACANTNTPES